MMFYYCADPMFLTDTTINPGNWGANIKHHSWGHKSASVEAQLENARHLLCPTAPSRLEAVYFCPRITDAIALQQDRKSDLIYSVTSTGSWAFVTDMALSRPLARYDPLWANRYWVSGFFVLIGEEDGDNVGVETAIVGGLRLASAEMQEELVKLLPCKVRAAYHAVDPDLASAKGLAPGRAPALFAAPELLSDAPLTTMGVIENV